MQKSVAKVFFCVEADDFAGESSLPLEGKIDTYANSRAICTEWIEPRMVSSDIVVRFGKSGCGTPRFLLLAEAPVGPSRRGPDAGTALATGVG